MTRLVIGGHNATIQREVDETIGIIDYVRQCCESLSSTYNEFPNQVVFAKIQRDHFGAMWMDYIYLHICLLAMYEYDKEAMKPIIKYIIAHEFRHWQISNGEIRLYGVSEEQECINFGLKQVNMTYDQIKSITYSIYQIISEVHNGK
jgi:hypothetical protein